MLTTDEIIRRCVQTHKNIYDYSKVEYKGDKHKIEIICLTGFFITFRFN